MVSGKNNFGILLQQLIQQADVKNAIIAHAVQYDISYISKWIGGKALPSEKNIEKIITDIAECIVAEAPEDKMDTLFRKYECKSQKELKKAIHDILLVAYDECKAKNRGTPARSEPRFYFELTIDNLAKKIRNSYVKIDCNCISVIDILSLAHEARLLLAGIENGHFTAPSDRSIKYSMVINIDNMPGEAPRDCVYDSIFLVHMLTCFSGIDFKIYNSSFAYGKFLHCVEGEYLLTATVFPERNHGLAVIESCEEKAATALYQHASFLVSQENLIFRKAIMSEIIEKKEYARSMVSTNIRWLLGHPTELLLPDDVFEELLNSYEFKKTDELRKLHILTQSIIEQSIVYMMLYESALSDIVISGELDFFNNKITLTLSQKIRCLEYLVGLLDIKDAKIKLIDSGFSKDFQYITNPCIFLSDSFCYLRLENKRYKDNILVLNDKSVKEMFEKFYSQIWNNRSDVVIMEKEEIRNRIIHYEESAYLMEKVK